MVISTSYQLEISWNHPTSVRPCFLVKTWHLAVSSVHPTCPCWDVATLLRPFWKNGKDWPLFGNHPFSVMILLWIGSWHVASIGSGIPGCSWNKSSVFGDLQLHTSHPSPKHSCWCLIALFWLVGPDIFFARSSFDLNWLTHFRSFRLLNATNCNNCASWLFSECLLLQPRVLALWAPICWLKVETNNQYRMFPHDIPPAPIAGII